jgi:competence protein ComEC
VIGVIVGEPAYSDRSQRLRVRAEEVRLPGDLTNLKVSGDLLAVLPRYPVYSLGERLSLVGSLTAPPRLSEFDYPAYLARQGVYSYMSFPKASAVGAGEAPFLTWLVARPRDAVRQALRRSVPEPAAALAVGVVTGDRSSLPEQVEEAFRRSGTTHVLAISGQNIALIVGFVWLIYSQGRSRRRMPGWLTALLLLGVGLYTLFTGAQPAVVRAAIMAAILLLAPSLGRRYDPVASIAIPALLMTAWDPDLLFDAGFQLSFSAMLGLALVAPLLYQLLRQCKLPAPAALPLSASLGAQAATFPLLALLTGSVSLVAPLATLSIDFALLPLMVAGIATGIAGSIIPWLGEMLGEVVWLCSAWLLWWTRMWASLPFAALQVTQASPALAVLYYFALGLVVWVASQGRRNARIRLFLARRWAAAMGVAAAALWTAAIGLLFFH